VLIAVVLLLSAAGYILYPRAHQSSLTDIVSKHMVLPDNESPAELTIVDKTKIKTQFLKKSENGDRVLIYQKHQRVIIYRPSIDRIVDVGVVQIDDVTPIQRRQGQ